MGGGAAAAGCVPRVRRRAPWSPAGPPPPAAAAGNKPTRAGTAAGRRRRRRGRRRKGRRGRREGRRGKPRAASCHFRVVFCCCSFRYMFGAAGSVQGGGDGPRGTWRHVAGSHKRSHEESRRSQWGAADSGKRAPATVVRREARPIARRPPSDVNSVSQSSKALPSNSRLGKIHSRVLTARAGSAASPDSNHRRRRRRRWAR